MRSIRIRTLGLLAALALLAALPAAQVQANNTRPHAVAAKHCRSGWVKAKLPSGTKCLHAGERCSRKRSFQRVYHRKGFHCKPNRRLRRRD